MPDATEWLVEYTDALDKPAYERALIPPAAAPAAETVCGKCGTVRPARGFCMVCDPPAAEEPAQECPQCAGTGCAPNHLSDICGACGGTGMRGEDESDDNPPAPAAETGKAQHKADCPATHHDPFREEMCTCKPARGAEALQSIRNRITEYLSHGGLLSPDLMDHDAVSRLMRDARDAINALLAARAAPPEREGK